MCVCSIFIHKQRARKRKKNSRFAAHQPMMTFQIPTVNFNWKLISTIQTVFFLLCIECKKKYFAEMLGWLECNRLNRRFLVFCHTTIFHKNFYYAAVWCDVMLACRVLINTYQDFVYIKSLIKFKLKQKNSIFKWKGT